jgi:AcrR family transcriptional regulator
VVDGVALGAGRRDRNRAEVRAKLHGAAARLFSEQGYESTAVEDIAESAGVSLRTFFRYFASKDDVLFAKEMDASGYVAALAREPLTLSPVQAMGAAYREQPPLSATDIQVHVLFHRAVGSSPTLQGRYFGGMHAFRDELAVALACRERRRVPTDADRLAATVGRTVLDHAYVGWLERGARGDLRQAVTRAFARFDAITAPTSVRI